MSSIVTPFYLNPPTKAGWLILKLKHLCLCGPVYGENIPADEYAAEGLRFIRTTDIDDAGHLSAEGVYIHSVAPEVRLKDGDLLLSRSGTIGRSFLYRSAIHGPCAHAGYLVRFRPKGVHTGRFLFWVTKSRPFLAQLASDAIESTIVNFNGQRYANLALLCPSGEEQRAIADFLDRETAKIDALIAAQERLIALLDEKRQATITHAVTKGLDPNVPMKESGVEWLGKVPRHWGVIPLKRCCRIPNGLVDPTVGRYATLSLIAPNHVQSGTGRLLEVETADDQGAISGKYHFAEGTVLYSKIRPALRKACVAPFEGLCSADMYPIYSTKIRPRLLLYQLLSDYFSSFAILSSDRVAMPKVNRETIGDFPMVVPPSAEQEVIVRYVDEAVAEIDRLGDRSVEVIERLRERRTALITAAVTGQIDVTRQAITETAK